MKKAFDFIQLKMMTVSTYEVSIHPDVQTAYYHRKGDWEYNKHYLTILKSPDNKTYKLFFDYMEVESDNCKSNFSGHSISWNQHYGNFILNGHVLLSHHKGEGQGSIQLGDKIYAASFRSMIAKYSVDIAKTDKVKLTPTKELSYDLKPEEWENLSWSENALKFQYHVDPSGSMASQTLYKTVMEFLDNDTKKSWQAVYDQANIFTSTCTSKMSGQGLFTMHMSVGKKPANDDRSSLPEDKSKYISLFPNQFSIQFNQTFSKGYGAISVEQGGKEEAYAIRLQMANEAIVGFYKFYQGNSVLGNIVVNRGKLYVYGEQHQNSWIKGDCLYWSDLKEHSFLPQYGCISFSPDGQMVIPDNSNIYTSGERLRCLPNNYDSINQNDDIYHAVNHIRGISHSKASESALNLYGLLNMDPTQFKTKTVTDKDGKEKEVEILVDIVQDNAMDDFYSILKYYMPKELREKFIGESTFIINDPTVKSIAQGDSNACKWYQDMAVPYLCSALSHTSLSDPYVKKLNSFRANTYMKNKMAKSDIYYSQSKQLFAYRWKCTFPLMKEYLVDQMDPTRIDAQNKDIDDITSEMVSQLEQEMKSIKEDKKKKMYEAAIKDLKDTAAKAKNGCYWAFMLYSFLCNYYFPSLLAMMISGNVSQTVSMDIKRFSAILEILDPTNEFNNAFVKTANFFQLSSIMPSMIDYTQDKSTYFDAAYAIIEEFITTYSTDSDPDINEAIAELYEKYQKEELRDELEKYMEAFISTSELLAPGLSFQTVAEIFEKKLIEKYSEKATFAVRMFGMALAAAGIAFIINGDIKWNDLSDTEKSTIILTGSALLIEGFLKALRNGMECHSFYIFSGSRLKAAMSFISPFSHYSDAMVHYNSTFSKWLLERGKHYPSTVFSELFAGEADIAEKAPKLTKIFGRNLDEFLSTRFSAILAIVGIVLSSIEISRSTEPLEKDMNIVFLTSSVLDLVSVAASWVGGAAFISSTGASICGIVAGLSAGFAIVAALSGLVMLIILLTSKKKIETPLENFCKNEANKYGMYMPDNVAIEHFVIGGSGENTDITGISIAWKPDKNCCLHVRSDKIIDVMSLDYSFYTVLFVTVDEQGTARILCHTGYKEASLAALSYIKEQDKTILKMMPNNKDNPKTQKWIFSLMNTKEGDIKWDKDGNIVSANFSIENKYIRDQNESKNQEDKEASFLNVSNLSVALSKTAQPWTLSFSGTKPYCLYYNENNELIFKKDSINQMFYPRLLFTGSTPLVWNIDKEDKLPMDIYFGSKGEIAEKENAKLDIFKKTSFTISAHNKYGEVNKEISIEIK